MAHKLSYAHEKILLTPHLFILRPPSILNHISATEWVMLKCKEHSVHNSIMLTSVNLPEIGLC